MRACTCFIRFPNTEKRVENCSGVFLSKLEVTFGNRMKHCLECLMYLSIEEEKTMAGVNGEIKSYKSM